MRRYDQIMKWIETAKPKTLIEVGTHNGRRAAQMIDAALRHQKTVHYRGYDLFEGMTPELKEAERNGKDVATYDKVYKYLSDHAAKRQNKFTFELIRGNTNETLTYPTVADFVFIDGGHSVPTIQHDYDAVRDSRVIIFDDYYEEDEKGLLVHDTKLYGCNQVVKNIKNHVVLKHRDKIKAGGYIRLVLIK